MNDLKKTKMIDLHKGPSASKREEVLDYFLKTWEIDEKLYDTLARDDSFYHRFEPLRHPLIFYLGHTAVFYINKFLIANIIDERINPYFESIFAVGVDEMSWDDLDDGNYEWPSVMEVKEYRNHVRELIVKVIKTMPLNPPINWESPWWGVIMGIEHERIHLETSSVIIRQAPLDHVIHKPFWDICPKKGKPPKNELITVKKRKVVMGKDFNDRLYGWDNEYGRHEREVQEFKASKYLVSNGEFLEFIEDGGYHNEDYWTEEGWEWVAFRRPDYPIFWEKQGDEYWLRTMTKRIKMPWDWPVEVNCLEAKAFCEWLSKIKGKSIRLPSEEEWTALREVSNIPDQPDWERAPGNINLEYWGSSCPVTEFPFGVFYDVIGNVWQWTETSIMGFDGFKVHPYYDDFSTPTFDGKHNLVKGGSWISTGNEASKTARYAFRRHFFQHAGLRYVESSEKVETPKVLYEEDEEVTRFCELHWGNEYGCVGNYPQNCVQKAMEAFPELKKNRALNLGAAAGRAAFELADYFDWVTALDFSARYIRPAIQINENSVLRYTLKEEGEIVSFHERKLDDFYPSQLSNKIEFWQADPANLKPQFSNYDFIIALNIIERLANPTLFLRRIYNRINRDGILMISSSNHWEGSGVDKENWLGGFRKDGEPFYTKDGLKEILREHFILVDKGLILDSVVRKNKWVFEHVKNEVTFWKRR